jgi:hypothetical protein
VAVWRAQGGPFESRSIAKAWAEANLKEQLRWIEDHPEVHAEHVQARADGIKRARLRAEQEEGGDDDQS